MKTDTYGTGRKSVAVLSSALLLSAFPQAAIPMPHDGGSPSHPIELASHTEPIPVAMNDEELAYLFGASNVTLARELIAYLDEREMNETEGRFGPVGAFVGGVTSGAGYVGGVIGSGQDGSWGDFAGAVVGGALLGGFLGPAGNLGANTVLGTQLGFYTGFIGGLVAGGCSGNCHSDKLDSSAIPPTHHRRLR